MVLVAWFVPGKIVFAFFVSGVLFRKHRVSEEGPKKVARLRWLYFLKKWVVKIEGKVLLMEEILLTTRHVLKPCK